MKEKSILIQTRYGEDMGGNIFYILKELAQNYADYELYLPYRKVIRKGKKPGESISGKTFYEKLLAKYRIENIHLVEIHKLRYWYLLATCKYLVNDVTFHTAFIKREGQIYLNTWHGTPLKKMGLDEETKGYLFGNMQRNFLASDFLLCPNVYMSKIMVSAYRLKNLFKGQIVNEGYPRNAIFFNNQRAKDIKKELNISDKQVIVYMPTWRESGKDKSYEEILLENLTEIDSKLRDDQLFFVKMHPYTRIQLQQNDFQHIRLFPGDYETYDFLNIADCLVTDYSSVMFDFACSRKHIILFTYDEAEYLQTRGLYTSMDELPFTRVSTASELMDAINEGKNYDENSFMEEILRYENKDAVGNICKILFGENKKFSTYVLPSNEKENVLFFADNLLKNGIFSSLFNLVNLIDLKKRNYFFIFKEATVKPNKERLSEIPPEIGVLSLGTIERTFSEVLALILYYKLNVNNSLVNKIVESYYKRNFLKYYGNVKVDCFIQFVGYGRDMLHIFLHGKKKVVFVHNDMNREIEKRKIQHRNTLEKCYQNYDAVACVSDATLTIAREIAQGKGEYRIVHNTCDSSGICKKSLEPVSFEKDTECLINNPKGLLGILNDKSITKFITIGRFSPEKGHRLLIDAFDRYWQENMDSFLMIVGGHGPYFSRTVKYVRTRQCWQNVAIVKSIKNPMPILKMSDLFVLSSSYEGLPMVLFEADSLNVPILSTNIDGPRDLLSSYNGGMLVEETEDGLYEGMKAFDRGEIKPLSIDFGKYNQQCIDEFESLFSS